MRGWPLYLSILGGAVVLAFALKALPPGVVIVIALIAIAAGSIRYRRVARPPKESVTAVGLGFERAGTDPFSLLSLPLALFARGSGQTISDLMWGNWGGVEAKVFSVGYTDGMGTRRRFTCALVPSPTEDLALVVEPKVFMVPDAERAPMPEVHLDDAAFTDAFDVRSDDRERAMRLLDETLRARLLSLRERWAMELRGGMLLMYSAAEGIDPLESLETVSLLRRVLAGPAPPTPSDEAVPREADPPG
ncbi:MAG TPA: DUF3137 domain-containing protein [Actinomycetota bacterium]|nr:DUF3137 domain-containing protein [Actinomycetota bacterium]